MRIAKWLMFFLISLSFTVPVEAVDLTLGGFPSYFRQRVRYIQDATYVNALNEQAAIADGFANTDDSLVFVDTTFRLTPQLKLSDVVTIRAQVDVFSNNLWGGLTSDLLGAGADRGSTVVNSGLSSQDRVRGPLLTGSSAVDDNGFMEFRMLHIDMVLPNNLGFVRIGRQPFDWGLGILANGGWDPNSDLGFLVDRFLWLKTFPTGDSSVTLVVVSDVLSQGNTFATGTGNAYDVGAVAVIYNVPDVGGVNVTLGGYVFPYIHQNNFSFGTREYAGGGDFDFNPVGDLDRFTLYSGLIDLKTDLWKVTAELQGGFGKISDFFGQEADTDISNQILWAVRGEMYPGTLPLSVVGAEFGWADGDKATTSALDEIEGGVIVFSPAYNLDNLLFKHMIPNIYQGANAIARNESSVQNAYYARAYATMKLNEMFSFTPQVLVAWNQETESVITAGQDIASYLGTEVEGTLTWNIYPGVTFDLIGSIIFAGDGLTDMLEQQAANVVGGLCDGTPDGATCAAASGSAEDVPYAIQGKLLVSIDQFFK